MYHIPFPDADLGVGSPFDLKMWGFPDLSTWFANDQLNPPDNHFIQ